ncbi:TPA: conjugation system SOS inhibitor PsiB [Salmonella enterica]|nr:conjugation system SOS inhibitor PsiB [Salmonella enterica]
MTTTLVYDRTRLTEMSAHELEESREAGYAFRRELTHAVMAGIAVPEAWDMNGEYRSEFGGFFPVQVQFTPAHGRFHVALCSPGEISDRWLMVLFSANRRSVAVVRHAQRYDPYVFAHVLSLTARLDQDGYPLGHIISVLQEDAVC